MNKTILGRIRECGITRIILFCNLCLICLFVFIFSGLVFAAEKANSWKPDPGMESIREEVVFNEPRMPVDRIAEATTNNGYWWIKQNSSTKLEYVKDLIKAFKLKGGYVGLTSKALVRKLDLVYNPKGDPLDIKMGLSLENAFSLIIKEDTK